MFDVVVIGAGIIGGMVARELSRYQLQVALVEKAHDVAMGTTKANSAIVHEGFDAENGSLKARLNVAGARKMEALCRELGVKYQKNGSLVIAYREADRPKIEALYERGVKNGLDDLEVIEAEKLHELEPSLSDQAVCALWAPGGAIICPYEFNIAAVGNAMDNGVKLFLDYQVESVSKTDEGFEVKGTGETLQTRFVVNAAGLYSDEIAAMIGDTSISIHPRKGQYMLLDHDCVGSVTHTLFNVPNELGKGILVSPTVDNNLILGPTAEDGTDKTDMATTPEGLQMVSENARKVIPGINLRGVITQFAGQRAVGNTGDFILKASCPGFVNAAGVESPGLSSAPAIAEYLIELLAKDGLELNQKADFDPVRKAPHLFNTLSLEEKNQIIAKDPRYGHIICRCESITEGEIMEALTQNPPARDLDGVKRRTRAGMGRCQGGFCSTQVMEMLREKLNVPMEQVTRFGGNSWMVTGYTREDPVGGEEA